MPRAHFEGIGWVSIRREDMLPVFCGVWIAKVEREWRYARSCRLHGLEITRVYAHPIEWGMLHCATSAILITTACTARSEDEFRSILLELGLWSSRTPQEREGYARRAAWLRRTLGTSKTRVMRSLERIAACREVPVSSEYARDVLCRKEYAPYAAEDGQLAAKEYCIPALMLLTGSCAEYAVLEKAVSEELRRTERELVRANMYLSKLEAAAACTRVFLDVLRFRHRYAL